MRRARLQIKPNLVKVAKPATKDKPPPPDGAKEVPLLGSSVSQDASNVAEVTPPTYNQVSETNSADNAAVASTDMVRPLSIDVSRPRTLSQSTRSLSPQKTLGERPTSMMSPTRRPTSPRKVNFNVMGDTRPPILLSPTSGRRSRLNSTCSQMSQTLSAPLKLKPQKFTGDEELNTRTMRMVDLIAWNPKKEKPLDKKKIEETVEKGKVPTMQESNAGKGALAPQVTIGPDGRIVLDEASLIIKDTEQAELWELVDEDRLSRKTTSMSFRKRIIRKGALWTEKETDLFYDILRCTGPDFGLMHDFFPTRSRNELKSKYNKEERRNWDRVCKTLSMPALLDDSLYEKSLEAIDEIKEEERLKKLAKERKKNGADADESDLPPATIDWDEVTADLEKEAEDLIGQLEEEYRLQKVADARRNKKKKLSSKAEQLLKETETEAKKDVIKIPERAEVEKRPTREKRNPEPALSGYEAGVVAPVPSAPSSSTEAEKQTKKSKFVNKSAIQALQRKMKESLNKKKQLAANRRNPTLNRNTDVIDIGAEEMNEPRPSSSTNQADEMQVDAPADPTIKRPVPIRPLSVYVSPAISPLPPISSMLSPLHVSPAPLDDLDVDIRGGGAFSPVPRSQSQLSQSAFCALSVGQRMADYDDRLAEVISPDPQSLAVSSNSAFQRPPTRNASTPSSVELSESFSTTLSLPSEPVPGNSGSHPVPVPERSQSQSHPVPGQASPEPQDLPTSSVRPKQQEKDKAQVEKTPDTVQQKEEPKKSDLQRVRVARVAHPARRGVGAVIRRPNIGNQNQSKTFVKSSGSGDSSRTSGTDNVTEISNDMPSVSKLGDLDSETTSVMKPEPVKRLPAVGVKRKAVEIDGVGSTQEADRVEETRMDERKKVKERPSLLRKPMIFEEQVEEAGLEGAVEEQGEKDSDRLREVEQSVDDDDQSCVIVGTSSSKTSPASVTPKPSLAKATHAALKRPIGSAIIRRPAGTRPARPAPSPRESLPESSSKSASTLPSNLSLDCSKLKSPEKGRGVSSEKPPPVSKVVPTTVKKIEFLPPLAQRPKRGKFSVVEVMEERTQKEETVRTSERVEKTKTKAGETGQREECAEKASEDQVTSTVVEKEKDVQVSEEVDTEVASVRAPRAAPMVVLSGTEPLVRPKRTRRRL